MSPAHSLNAAEERSACEYRLLITTNSPLGGLIGSPDAGGSPELGSAGSFDAHEPDVSLMFLKRSA